MTYSYKYLTVLKQKDPISSIQRQARDGSFTEIEKKAYEGSTRIRLNYQRRKICLYGEAFLYISLSKPHNLWHVDIDYFFPKVIFMHVKDIFQFTIWFERKLNLYENTYVVIKRKRKS